MTITCEIEDNYITLTLRGLTIGFNLPTDNSYHDSIYPSSFEKFETSDEWDIGGRKYLFELTVKDWILTWYRWTLELDTKYSIELDDEEKQQWIDIARRISEI